MTNLDWILEVRKSAESRKRNIILFFAFGTLMAALFAAVLSLRANAQNATISHHSIDSYGHRIARSTGEDFKTQIHHSTRFF